MTPLYLVLLAAAAVCFLLAAVGVAAPRLNLLAFGLLCLTLVPLIQTMKEI